MSKVYRISLICVMVVAMITLCILLYRYENHESSANPELDFSSINNMDINIDSVSDKKEEQIQNTDPIILTTTDSIVVTNADTSLVIIEYFPGGISRETHMDLPKEWEGLDRTGILEILEEYSLNPENIDIEKGLYKIEMTSFSSELVTIEKSYHKEPLDYYYLAFMDDYVTVFYEDKTTILLTTEIHGDQLPDSLRAEILNYKLLAGNAELFAFLETYTS